jgi:hypothetical protein
MSMSQIGQKNETVPRREFSTHHKRPKTHPFADGFFLRYIVFKETMRLPKELRDIIWEYIHAFNIILELPKKSAIRRLIRKSNQDILKRFIDVQISLNNGMLYMSPFFFRNFVLHNPITLSILTDCVVQSVRLYPSTGALKWLFLDNDLYLRPDYFQILQSSVLFDVITHVEFPVFI